MYSILEVSPLPDAFLTLLRMLWTLMFIYWNANALLES